MTSKELNLALKARLQLVHEPVCVQQSSLDLIGLFRVVDRGVCVHCCGGCVWSRTVLLF